jgi:transposase
MAKPYSIDLRERVVSAVEAGGLSRRGAAAHFGVGVSTVITWVRRFRETGSIEPRQMGGYKPVLLAAHRDFVHARFAEQPELTLRGLQQELADRGVRVSYGAVWAFVHGEGLSFKKNRTGQRAGASRRRSATPTMEEVSGAD